MAVLPFYVGIYWCWQSHLVLAAWQSQGVSVFPPGLWLLDLYCSSFLLLPQNLFRVHKSLQQSYHFEGHRKIMLLSQITSRCQRLISLSLLTYPAIPIEMGTSARLLFPGSQTKSWAKVLCILRCTHVSGDVPMVCQDWAQISSDPTDISLSWHISNSCLHTSENVI